MALASLLETEKYGVWIIPTIAFGEPVEVVDFMEITNNFKRIYTRMYLK